MDVKGAKALSERLAEAARNVDPPPAKAVGSETRTLVAMRPAMPTQDARLSNISDPRSLASTERRKSPPRPRSRTHSDECPWTYSAG